MILSYREPFVDPDRRAGQVAVYQILECAPGYLRMRLVDEWRRTDSGDPVVWDLVSESPNRYCWHRTDWPAGACTADVLRCPS